MKYKIISKRIIEDYKKYGASDELCSWTKKLDGEIVDFENGSNVTKIGLFLIHKKWCEPVENVSVETICDYTNELAENVSRETICDYTNTIEKVKDYCIKNIERIDKMTETAISTDADIGMNYAYRKILDIIESEGKNNDIKN